MASTFRRNARPKGPSPARLSSLRGTKPSTGGVTLTSSGLRDLDQILGALPLGTCVLLEQDRWTQSFAITILKYWCAQALCHEQDLVVAVEDNSSEIDLSSESPWSTNVFQESDTVSTGSRKEIKSVLQHLPKSLNIEKDRRKQSVATTSSSNIPLDSLQEIDEEGEDDKDAAEDDLKIAWQYKKKVQLERQGGVTGDDTENATGLDAEDTFCHSFDLQGLLSKQLDVTQRCHFVNTQSSTNVTEYFRELSRILPTTKQDKVTRFLIYEPNLPLLRTALPLLLSVIREKKLPIVMLVVIKPWYQDDLSALVSLRRTVDTVLQTEGFASRQIYPPPPEFRMFQGLLRVPKAATVTAYTAHAGGHFAEFTTTKRPTSDLYGLRRDRRKLHIQLLHIPPEEYAQGGGSVGSGGVRSGAGRVEKTGLGCAPSGGPSLDF